MAAFNIAFDPPDRVGSLSAPQRPIDFAHLSRQTMGDKALEAEVLALFAREARRTIDALASAHADERAALAHRLKGAAAGVGARFVETAATQLEAAPGSARRLASLTAAVAEVSDFICALAR